MESKEKKNLISSFLLCGSKSLPVSSSKDSSPSKQSGLIVDVEKQSKNESHQRKPGGWKAMPFVLGNETFERLANIGLVANFSVFMMTQFHLDQVSASNVLSIWSGATSFFPLIGAFICDAYLGRFLTISVATIAAFLGMVTLTLVPWVRELHPPPCNFLQEPQTCKGPTSGQMGFLILALTFLAIGAGGIRPCSIPFGVDQFDPNTDEGRKGINSFFNWYYATFTVVLIIAQTVVVYIQNNVSWVLGFGIPAILMFMGIVVFFSGTRLYIYVNPEGSIFSDIAYTIIAAYKKRKLKLPDAGRDMYGAFYDPPPIGRVLRKIPLTNQFRCLNKAALIGEGELNLDGTPANKWRLSSVQRVEEIKCILRIIPIWASGIICLLSIAQQGTFTVSQALKMDRHIGPRFQVPAGSLGVISLLTVAIIIPIYDRIIIPFLRKRTKIEGGLTLLQRIGTGIAFSILSMIVAGLIERRRRDLANEHAKTISVFWLAPQLILMGFCEAFNIIGQIEFYNKEFPESLASLANSLFSMTFAGANYVSIIVVNVVHKTTATRNHPDWLTTDINAGRLENFYYVIAAMGALNFIYFLVVAPRYKYKSRVRVDEEEPQFGVIELKTTKN